MLSSPSLHVYLFSPLSQTNKAPWFPCELHFSNFCSQKNFINLAALELAAPALPICCCLWNKICVKYIWFDWGVFTCFPNSHYGLWVQANIVSMCVSPCVYMLHCMCVRCQTMHDWPEILSYNLQWNVEARDGEERQRGSEEDEKQRWKDRGNNNSRQCSLGQWWWDDYLLCCGACCIKTNQPYLLNDSIFPSCTKITYWELEPRLT